MRSTTAYFFATALSDADDAAPASWIATSAFSPCAILYFALCTHLDVSPRMADLDASNAKHLASPRKIGTRVPSLLLVEEELRKMS